MNVTSFLISKVIAEKEGLDKDAANRMALTGAISGTAQQVLVTQQMAKTAAAAKPETIQKEIGKQGLATKDELEGAVSAKLPEVVKDELPGVVKAALLGVVKPELPGVVKAELLGVVKPELPGVVKAELPGVIEDELTLSIIAGKLEAVGEGTPEAMQLVQMVAKVLATAVAEGESGDVNVKALKDSLVQLYPRPK